MAALRLQYLVCLFWWRGARQPVAVGFAPTGAERRLRIPLSRSGSVLLFSHNAIVSCQRKKRTRSGGPRSCADRSEAETESPSLVLFKRKLNPELPADRIHLLHNPYRLRMRHFLALNLTLFQRSFAGKDFVLISRNLLRNRILLRQNEF